MLRIRAAIGTVLAVLIVMDCELAAQHRPETRAAFDHYIAQAESRIAGDRGNPKTFLSLESLSAAPEPEMLSRLRRGEVVIEKLGNTPAEISGGLIHDWSGAVFISGTNIQQLLAIVQNYDSLTRYYSPDVLESKLISAKSDDFHVFVRLRKHKVVTVVLDTEYDVHYGRIDPRHQYSISRSTRVSEIEDPGAPNEHALPDGGDHGYMWRLNSYWAFEQAEDGVFVQCEAISLTRDIPTGLGWLVGPFVTSIPRESLEFTLNATRAALSGKTRVTDRHD